jgi:glycosyltransferase involved in cell wall biosynthesis
MKLSVIICTHNPREDYLRRTLESLDRQSLPKDQWEFLLIDNASREPVAASWDLSWHPAGRHVLEEELGLTPARVRGIRETATDLIVFIDDDNVVDFRYLERVIRIAGDNPNLGCFGAGYLIPEYEDNPAAELEPFMPMLALREEPLPRWSNIPTDYWVPWGAGLAVRRDLAGWYEESVSSSKAKEMLDRKGTGLNSCGDDEFSWLACENGLGRGIFPELRITHLIGRNRVQKSYLLAIAEGHAFSHALLRFIHGEEFELEESTSWGNFFKMLGSGKVAFAIRECDRCWRFQRMSPLQKEFAHARAKGLERFRNTIHA